MAAVVEYEPTRSFICDFEEYETLKEGHVRVHVYIGLKK